MSLVPDPLRAGAVQASATTTRARWFARQSVEGRAYILMLCALIGIPIVGLVAVTTVSMPAPAYFATSLVAVGTPFLGLVWVGPGGGAPPVLTAWLRRREVARLNAALEPG